MGRNLEKDAVEMAAKNQRIMEEGFRIFAERTIDKVKMTDVAEAAGIGIASLYRYYSSKPKLVIAISTWVWERYTAELIKKLETSENAGLTAAEKYDLYLEFFLDMYRDHRDMLRFNQFFNVYLQSEGISDEQMKPFTDLIRALEKRFEATCRQGLEDGTLRMELSEERMFSVTAHLMLAAVTRYAVGLAYTDGTDAEKELELQKELLFKRFTT